jgi:hypothetical protein
LIISFLGFFYNEIVDCPLDIYQRCAMTDSTFTCLYCHSSLNASPGESFVTCPTCKGTVVVPFALRRENQQNKVPFQAAPAQRKPAKLAKPVTPAIQPLDIQQAKPAAQVQNVMDQLRQINTFPKRIPAARRISCIMAALIIVLAFACLAFVLASMP